MTYATEEPISTEVALSSVGRERERQYTKWGPQHHPDGTDDGFTAKAKREYARRICDENAAAGRGTWLDILTEEVAEAFAETDPVKLRKELVQVAAVAVAWVEDIDSREKVGS